MVFERQRIYSLYGPYSIYVRMVVCKYICTHGFECDYVCVAGNDMRVHTWWLPRLSTTAYG